jgi:hypothetical protein
MYNGISSNSEKRSEGNHLAKLVRSEIVKWVAPIKASCISVD